MKLPPIDTLPTAGIPQAYQPFRGDRRAFERAASAKITIPKPKPPPWQQVLGDKPKPIVRPIRRRK
jgi:hypothetical protein